MNSELLELQPGPQRQQADVLAIGTVVIVSTAANVLSRDLTSPVLIALALLILSFHRITYNFRHAVWPLSIIVVLGFSGLAGHEFRDIARDFFFALTPIALMFIGFWLAERERFWDDLPVVLVWLGVIFALRHLSAFVVEPSLLFAESMTVRASTGNVADITVLGFLVLLFINRFTPGRRPMRGLAFWVAFAVLLASIILSYSRTALVVLVLGTMAARGWLSGRNLKWPLLIGAGLALLLTMQGDDGGDIQKLTFMSKLTRSLDEVALANYDTMSDISLNWRGFETYKVLEQYTTGSPLQQVIGQGYGALVDLGFYMALGGDASVEFRFIPVMHNGYGYVLFKYGIIGILMYLAFYTKLIRFAVRNQTSPSAQTVFCARFLLGLTLSLIFVMFVGNGMAQLTDSEYVVLMGVLLGKIQHNNQQLQSAAA